MGRAKALQNLPRHRFRDDQLTGELAEQVGTLRGKSSSRNSDRKNPVASEPPGLDDHLRIAPFIPPDGEPKGPAAGRTVVDQVAGEGPAYLEAEDVTAVGAADLELFHRDEDTWTGTGVPAGGGAGVSRGGAGSTVVPRSTGGRARVLHLQARRRVRRGVAGESWTKNTFRCMICPEP